MAYEARRDDDLEKQQKKAESDAANQKAIQVAADVASKSGNAYAAGIGKAIQTADSFSGGKASEFGGKVTTQANKLAPFAQGLTNKVANSKIADKAYDVYNAKNKKGAEALDKAKDGANKVKEGTEKAKEGADKVKDAQDKKKLLEQNGNKGGESNNSLPSSSEENKDEKDGNKKGTAGLFGFAGLAPIVVMIAPLFIMIFFVFFVVLSMVTTFSDYEDAFGISQLIGADTGGIDGTVSNPDQNEFYSRIVEVQNEFQSNGKTVDPLLIVSFYHSLNTYDAKVSYNEITKGKITQIANAMFEDNVYSEDVFKTNLKNSIIPIYLPFSNSVERDGIINETFEFIERYHSLIGQDNNTCFSGGSCTYGIKGFYISGSNIKKDINVNDLYVRLMQCGSYNGHNAGGTWGKPLEGEELIPFEKYILGVAYQEIGTGVSEEAFKAQMIAARSYILARPTQMGSATKWRSLKKENGKWVLQVASCTADQVYCDPDKGCSSQGGDAQWKQVYSGTGHGRTIKGPLAQNSKYRQYATEVQGEVLVNKNGYIVLTDYTDVETQKFASLGRKGYDYKQIMLQVYSQKYPNAGALSIYKADCGICVSNGEYAKWKQYQGEWVNVTLGNSGKTIKQIGCLATSLAIQVAKSGVQTNVSNLNPGTFVQYLNGKGAFGSGGDLLSYDSIANVAPSFKYQGYKDVSGMSRIDKLNTIKGIVGQSGVYAVAEVKGNTGQHWVAIDSINGDIINMMDPGSSSTNMWNEYNWVNTSRIVYYKVG